MTDDIIDADGIESLTVAEAASPDGAEFIVDCPATRDGNHELGEFGGD